MSQYTWVYCDQRQGSWARVGALGVGLGVAAGAQQALGRGGTARACAGRWRAAWARRACGMGAQGVRRAGRGSAGCAGGGVQGARGAQRAQQAGARAAGERQQARTRAERAGQGWLGGRRAAWARELARTVHSVHST